MHFAFDLESFNDTDESEIALSLRGDDYETDELQALLSQGDFSKVVSLSLKDWPADRLSFFAFEGLRNLKALSILRCPLSDDDLRALAFFDVLETLSLKFVELRAPGLSLVLEGLSPALKKLDLDENKLADKGAQVLSEHPRAAQLRALTLCSNRVRAKGAMSLAESRGFAKLEHLDLSYNALRAEGACALLLSTTLSLSELGLYQNKLLDDFAHALSDKRGHDKSALYRKLKVLNVGSNKISSEGMSALASIDFASLRGLLIHKNPLALEGAKALSEAPWFRGLENLMVKERDVGSEGKALLFASAITAN